MDSAYNYNELPLAAQTLHAELVDRLRIRQQERAGVPPKASVVTKTVKGHRYLYLQYAVLGRRRQIYLGRETPETRARVETYAAVWQADEAGRQDVGAAVKMLRAAGIATPPGRQSKVIEVLGDQRVFDLGAVLVGSTAFASYEPMLGLRFGPIARTEDIDVAAPLRVELAAPAVRPFEAVLQLTDLPFHAVPALDPRQPSTSYKVRSRALRVDVLTPMIGPETPEPVEIPWLGTAALPLRYLDYLIEDAIWGAVLTRHGTLARLPAPARYALHKVLIAGLRQVALHTKSAKDLAQASTLIAALHEERPGDLEDAWSALQARGPSWTGRFERGRARLHRDARRVLDEVIG